MHVVSCEGQLFIPKQKVVSGIPCPNNRFQHRRWVVVKHVCSFDLVKALILVPLSMEVLKTPQMGKKDIFKCGSGGTDQNIPDAERLDSMLADEELSTTILSPDDSLGLSFRAFPSTNLNAKAIF
jgi:hypothetical protein